ncbi:MAG: hypothetical protein ABIQ61_02480 [Ornithinibacter sp.]
MTAPTDQHLAPVVGVRGIHRIWDPRVWGTIIGAVGASVFVMANRAELPAPWSLVAVLTWVLALAVYLWQVFGARRDFGPVTPVAPRSRLVYPASVLGMLLLIRLGSAVVDAADRPGLRSAVIVVAVGLHFLPFAAAFHTPMFTRLGTLMALIGATGLAVGWLVDPRWAAAAAVLTGVAMLVVIAADAAARVRPGRGR